MQPYRRSHEEPPEYGPVYLAIERALWAFGPALIFLMLLNFPVTHAARQEAEAAFAADVAAENLEYCAKWANGAWVGRTCGLRTGSGGNSGQS